MTQFDLDKPPKLLTAGQWRDRFMTSLIMTLAAALFIGYAGSVRWPIWTFFIGLLIAGNGVIFTAVSFLNWRDARRTKQLSPGSNSKEGTSPHA